MGRKETRRAIKERIRRTEKWERGRVWKRGRRGRGGVKNTSWCARLERCGGGGKKEAPMCPAPDKAPD